jgi:hypothetical protein
MITIQASPGINCIYNDYPSECPECGKQIIPIVHTQFTKNTNSYVFLECPNASCGIGFVYDFSLHYRAANNHYYSFNRLVKGSLKKSIQNERIERLSPSFVSVYTQSEHAEGFGLYQICGAGYVKALEHLIKDFLVYQTPSGESLFRKASLGQCISEFVDNERIRATAKIAYWIQNEDQNPNRVWRERELKDVKSLINLTTNWIDMELLSREFEAAMPELAMYM